MATCFDTNNNNLDTSDEDIILYELFGCPHISSAAERR